MTERKIVIPGEVIFSGEDYLPGKGTEIKKKVGFIVSIFSFKSEIKIESI